MKDITLDNSRVKHPEPGHIANLADDLPTLHVEYVAALAGWLARMVGALMPEMRG